MIVLLGGFPGSGKTFICRKLVEELGFKSVEVGQQLRDRYGEKAFLGTANLRAPAEFEDVARDIVREAVGHYFQAYETTNLVIDSTPRNIGQVDFLKIVIPHAKEIGLWVFANTVIRTNRLSLRGGASYELATTATYEEEIAAWTAFTGQVACGIFENARSWEDYGARAALSAVILSTWSRRGTPGVIDGGRISTGGIDDIPDSSEEAGGVATSTK